jgi:anti-sigma factor ChrR (cupin superfamily)
MPDQQAIASRRTGSVFLPASLTADTDTPWVPLGPGRAFKPIRFLRDDRGYVALMSVEPGHGIPPHRHTGEVHAFNLEGFRRLDSGEVVGPGDYVFEPAGNTDSWATEGDAPVIVLIVVNGAVEYLGPDDQVVARYSAATQETAYRRYCEEHALPALDLLD